MKKNLYKMTSKKRLFNPKLLLKKRQKKSVSQPKSSSIKKEKEKENIHKKQALKEETKNIIKTNYNDIFEGKYSKFLELVNPLLGVRGKRININELRYILEEIYSIRFINDTSNIEANNGEDSDSMPFPNFVFEFLTYKYVKKPLVDQHSLDLLLSIEYYKNYDEVINIFSKFLNEELDPDDLEFYLYVRSCLEKEMKLMFIEVSRELMKKRSNDDKDKLYLNVKSCINVANSIYGNEQEELLNSFMKKIEDILTMQKTEGTYRQNLISVENILSITLYDYHENKFSPDKNNESPENKYMGIFENLQKTYGAEANLNQEEKVNRLKMIIVTYIKEKELDVFFNKLLNSYMIYEKSQKNIEEIMVSIKELVSKKINLLIKILFDFDEKAWFNSLKLKEDDKDGKESYDKLTNLIKQMMACEKINDITEPNVEEFGQTLLSTPELNSQINKLVIKRFE